MDEEFLKEIAALIKPVAIVELEYRFHYNNDGDIYLCTMQQHPENTQYIVVDKETYYNYFRYHVVDGALKIIDTTPKMSVQLKRSNQGYATVKNHAGILLENGETYADIEYYDTIN